MQQDIRTSVIANSRVERVDFHLHSYASNVTDYYAANSFSIPESYSDPIKLYHMLKKRGMSLVTLTDHNSIDGVREMLDRGFKDVFISSEITTTFPEDGCNIHITVGNMTESQFAEVDRLRANVYEMVAYVDAQIAAERTPNHAGNKLVYFMTHPLMSTQNRPYGREGSLSVAHIEKALLLCNCIEVRNGARTRVLNDLTWEIVQGLDRSIIERLANQHGIEPKGPTPWLKSVVGGSDDHAGINPGTTWTEFQLGNTTALSANAMVDSIRARQSRPDGVHGGPVTIAHSILKLLYEGGDSRNTLASQKAVSVGGSMQSLLKLVFDADNQSLIDKLSFQLRHGLFRFKQTWSRSHGGKPFEAVLETEVYDMLADCDFRDKVNVAATMDDRIFLVITTLVNRIFAHYVRNLRRTESLNIVSAIKESVALVSSNLFVSLPYLVAFMAQSADCQIARDVRRAFKVRESQKVVLVTDTFFEVNGVSNSIKRMIRESIRRDIDFTVVTCVADSDFERLAKDPDTVAFVAAGKLKMFRAVADLGFPQYDGLQICFPPLLDMLKYLQESGFTKMQISTPGVVGLAGLVAAKLLQIETAATYHTSFPEYVENYTKDVSLEAMAWKYMLMFYHSVDEMLVPSQFVAKHLHKRGLRNRKLLILDRWVDVDRFHPDKRVDGFWLDFDVAANAIKFVYVGRVAIEKNLHILAQAFKKLHETTPNAHLVIIGDGPYREALAEQLAGLPTTFTGYLHGDRLAAALASCDVKVFPSTTDTWGNAPLEAQASGLPVIVTDIGGPAELMLDGVTGLIVRGSDVRCLHDAMERMMEPDARAAMGRAARVYAEANRVDEPFTAVLDSEAYRRQLRKKKRLEEERDDREALRIKTMRNVGNLEASNQPLESTMAIGAPQRVAAANH